MFDIEIAGEALEDLNGFRKYDRARISAEIEIQLAQEPDCQTKNRKKLRPGHVANWEIRIGEIRVFYDVDRDASLVRVVRVGYKERNRLFFRGQERPQ